MVALFRVDVVGGRSRLTYLGFLTAEEKQIITQHHDADTLMLYLLNYEALCMEDNLLEAAKDLF